MSGQRALLLFIGAAALLSAISLTLRPKKDIVPVTGGTLAMQCDGCSARHADLAKKAQARED